MNLNNSDDTICAPATIPGTGAISIIRVSGKDTFSVADKVLKTNGLSISETEGYRLRYCTVYTDNGDNVLDNVLVSVFRAPHSYTGEDSVEISCHASKYIVSELMRLLVKAGARVAEPGEFTQRAFLNGKMDLAQAEAVADVISAQSEAAHRVAMNQLKGGYSKELKSLRGELLKMTSLLELELDFSEEDVEFASRDELSSLLDDAIRHIHSLTDSFRYGNALRGGVPVAIVGAVNAGKSTLLNALLRDDRAIVSDIAGTTRDTVEETMTIDGVLFRFIDTAGLRETSDAVEKIGISRSYKKMGEASVVLALLDAGKSAEALEAELSGLLPIVDLRQQELFIALNKIDALSPKEADKKNAFVKSYVVSASSVVHASVPPADVAASADSGDSGQPGQGAEKIKVLPISARTEAGLDELRRLLSDSRKSAATDSDQTVVTNLRHYQALTEACVALERVSTSLSSGLTPDLLAEDLREALSHLGEITGEITSDEVLGEIFGKFCIGK